MAGPLSPQAQQKVASLREMGYKIQHVYGLVERYAATSDERQAEALVQPLKRAFGRLKLQLMGAGFDSMSQLAGSMEIAAGRSNRSKARILREGIGSLKFQVEQEARKVIAEDKDAARAGADAPDGPPTPPQAG
ncbi:MAG TPA: hypothetical protein VMM12_08040 [Longimicrobiales bacterium]|nr:hypothetical protein [Longimicrobiales bacterium]